MGEVIDIAAELAKDNPKASAVALRIYADALRTYNEAADNVRKHGAICSHPRTGAPIENPYLKIRAQQAAVLSKMPAIKSNRVLSMLQPAVDDAALDELP